MTAEEAPVPLVTCLFNPWPHNLDDECQNVTRLPGRARFCDDTGPHGWHEWYDPTIRWECPGRLDRTNETT